MKITGKFFFFYIFFFPILFSILVNGYQNKVSDFDNGYTRLTKIKFSSSIMVTRKPKTIPLDNLAARSKKEKKRGGEKKKNFPIVRDNYFVSETCLKIFFFFFFTQSFIFQAHDSLPNSLHLPSKRGKKKKKGWKREYPLLEARRCNIWR